MRRRQWNWNPGGWFLMVTIGHSFGLGFAGHSIRFNGIDIFLGPVILTVQPPPPKWLVDDIAKPSD